ncbi:Hypothetical predicted protein [Prunus dulcis]|uniref:DYW domain-containing protein n=1 Tax=Prunus dulcis TaxID=3755 RepID=A0A5E4G873_PRUDU|nr:Hypothetical predicted protein [Prunus dulcis]
MWNSMISSYISHKKSKEGIGLYERMVLDGVCLDEYTFSCVFKAFSNLGLINEGRRGHGLSVVLGLEVSNAFVRSGLVDMYAKFGRMKDARLLSNRAVDKDVVLFMALIVGYSQHGDDDLTNGKLVHGLVIKSGYEPAVASQTSLLTMYARCGLIGDSLGIFKRFPNPNHVTWTSLIVGLVRNGREELALTKFRIMIRNSIIPNCLTLSRKQIHTMVTKFGLDRDIYAGAALVNLYGKCGSTEMASYAQNGFGHEAPELFNSMKELGLEPNEVTILSVLLACNNSGLVHEGCQIFATITNNQTTELEEAEALVKQVGNPDVVLWRTLLSACKLHGEVEMAERAVNKFKKNPAMSWVDVDREVHTFMAGDLSHPRSREINETLEKLIGKVKLLGYVPDTRFVLQDMDEELKKRSLYYHSEKLAISFALLMSSNKNTIIRIFKNLRVCGDCHSWIKFVTKVSGREIIARDAKRFHHFKDGLCSCGDYW